MDTTHLWKHAVIYHPSRPGEFEGVVAGEPAYKPSPQFIAFTSNTNSKKRMDILGFTSRESDSSPHPPKVSWWLANQQRWAAAKSRRKCYKGRSVKLIVPIVQLKKLEQFYLTRYTNNNVHNNKRVHQKEATYRRWGAKELRNRFKDILALAKDFLRYGNSWSTATAEYTL